MNTSREEMLDRVVFRWEGNRERTGTEIVAVAHSCDRDRAETLRAELAPLLSVEGGRQRGIVRYLLQESGQVALITREPVTDATGRTGTLSHALVGSWGALRPRLCLALGALDWVRNLPGDGASRRLAPVPRAELSRLALQPWRRLAVRVPRVGTALAVVAAQLLRTPDRLVSVRIPEFSDGRENNGPLLVWGLCGIFGDWFGRDYWTYATYDTVDSRGLRVVCVPEWPEWRTSAAEDSRLERVVLRNHPADEAQRIADELVALFLADPERPEELRLLFRRCPNGPELPLQRRLAVLRQYLRMARRGQGSRPGAAGRDPAGGMPGRESGTAFPSGSGAPATADGTVRGGSFPARLGGAPGAPSRVNRPPQVPSVADLTGRRKPVHPPRRASGTGPAAQRTAPPGIPGSRHSRPAEVPPRPADPDQSAGWRPSTITSRPLPGQPPPRPPGPRPPAEASAERASSLPGPGDSPGQPPAGGRPSGSGQPPDPASSATGPRALPEGHTHKPDSSEPDLSGADSSRNRAGASPPVQPAPHRPPGEDHRREEPPPSANRPMVPRPRTGSSSHGDRHEPAKKPPVCFAPTAADPQKDAAGASGTGAGTPPAAAPAHPGPASHPGRGSQPPRTLLAHRKTPVRATGLRRLGRWLSPAEWRRLRGPGASTEEILVTAERIATNPTATRAAHEAALKDLTRLPDRVLLDELAGSQLAQPYADLLLEALAERTRWRTVGDANLVGRRVLEQRLFLDHRHRLTDGQDDEHEAEVAAHNAAWIFGWAVLPYVTHPGVAGALVRLLNVLCKSQDRTEQRFLELAVLIPAERGRLDLPPQAWGEVVRYLRGGPHGRERARRPAQAAGPSGHPDGERAPSQPSQRGPHRVEPAPDDRWKLLSLVLGFTVLVLGVVWYAAAT